MDCTPAIPSHLSSHLTVQRAVTFFLESFRCSDPKVPATPTKDFEAHLGGQQVALHHAPRSAQQACQPMGHAGCSVAGSLLGSDADLQDGEKEKAC